MTAQNESQFSISNPCSLFLHDEISGHKRRLGLLGAKRTTITVHRSEEILPREVGHLVRQSTSVSSEGEGEFAAELGEGGSDR